MIQKSKIYYSESQGNLRDKEILKRYDVMIDYYTTNPGRVLDNKESLSLLYYNDRVLMENERLRSKLLNVLNVGIKKQENKK